jgi:hypothetical protein
MAAQTKKPRKPYKPRAKTAEQLLVERILAGDFAKSPEEAALNAEAAKLHAEASGTAKPTKLSAVDGRIERPGGEAYERLANWLPPMAKDEELAKPYGKEIREAEQRVREERFAKLSPAEQELELLKDSQAAALAAYELESDYAAWRDTPAVKDALAKLKALDERTAADPDWTWDQTVTIAQAVAAIETTGVDKTAALALASSAFDIDRQKKLAKMTEHEAAIEKLRVELAILADKPADDPSKADDKKTDDTGAEDDDSASPFEDALAILARLRGEAKKEDAKPADDASKEGDAAKEGE